MPTSVGPNTFGEENLVFGYDLGDTVNSYKGEPTTNQLTNSDFSNGTTGWTFGSWDGGRYTYTTETVIGPFGRPVSALKVVRTTSDTSYAHFHQGNGGKFTNGNTYTISVYVKGSGTLGQYNQGGYSPIVYRPGQFVTLSNEWTRISYTLTSQTDSLYPYWAAESITQNVPMYFVFAQSEVKDHVTPYTTGTRSATQGLIDLKGTSTIDLTNVSFDSNAQMNFDGTNDQFTISDPNIGTTFSIEIIVKVDDYSNSPILISPNSVGIDHFLRINNSGKVFARFIEVANSSTDDYIGTTTLTLGKFYHVTATKSPTNGTIYVNGVAKDSHTPTLPAAAWSGTWKIGARANNTFWFNGELPVIKIYNRALTASEVASNFNAIKSRFSI